MLQGKLGQGLPGLHQGAAWCWESGAVSQAFFSRALDPASLHLAILLLPQLLLALVLQLLLEAGQAARLVQGQPLLHCVEQGAVTSSHVLWGPPSGCLQASLAGRGCDAPLGVRWGPCRKPCGGGCWVGKALCRAAGAPLLFLRPAEHTHREDVNPPSFHREDALTLGLASKL